jgi:putative ABC transport system permease protein
MPASKHEPIAVWSQSWADFVFEWRAASTSLARIAVVFAAAAAFLRLTFVSLPQRSPMRNLRHDVVHAARRLKRSPLYTSFAAVTLGIGIAATTSLYALLYSIVWRPDATRSPEQIVELVGNAVIPGRVGLQGRFSWADWLSLAEQQRSFAQVAGSLRFGISIANKGSVDAVMAEAVTSDYFSMVGVGPLSGRILGSADSAPSAPSVVVLTARLARAQLGGEQAAIGRTLMVGGQLAEVVGVVSDQFNGFSVAYAPVSMWLPVEQLTRIKPRPFSSFDPAQRDRQWLSVRGRLREGVSLPKAGEELSLIGQRIETAFPTASAAAAPQKGTPAGRYWYAQPVSTRDGEVFSSLGLAMMVGVTLVLLMVCSNLASLGLSRSAPRQPEFAVRRAMGASRWRLVREQLVECSLVVGLGAVVAFWGTRWLINWMHTDVPMGLATLPLRPELSWPVVAAAAGASIVSMIFVGLGPAWRATKADLRPHLAQDGATTRPRVRSQHMLVAAQVAGSATLLLLAISIMNTVKEGSRSPGIDIDRIAIASIGFYLSPREAVEADRLRDEILRRLEQTPGIDRAAASVSLPFGMGAIQDSLALTEAELANPRAGENAYFVFGTEDLMDTLGIPLIAGRTFSADDVRDRRPVIVLSEKTSKAIFGSTDIVGRTVWLRHTPPRIPPVPPTFQALTVVGVSADTDVFNMGMRHAGVVFMPFRREANETMTLVARTEGDTDELAGTISRTIREADAGLVVGQVGSGWKLLSGRYLLLGTLAWASSLLGGLTLILVMSGLFGVLSALVTQQTREFGIRMALGGTPRDVLRLVVYQGVRPARDGLIVGLILGVLSRMALGAIFPSRIPVVDVFAFVAVPLLIVVITLLSSLVPARRAAGVDPNVALRTN